MKRQTLGYVAPNILLDSGAFSVWKYGATLNLEDYIDFCLEHEDILWRVVNLDVIPGSPGKPRTKFAVESAAAQGAKNLVRMRKRGVDAMPVFHQGESFKWLQRMLDEGATYIGLSPNKSLATSGKMHWLDQCFDYLCGNGGYPEVKLHAFGETSIRILRKYPWYSADSSSWVLAGAMGGVFVPPATRDGEFDWTGKPSIYTVSDGLNGTTATSAQRQGKSLRTMGQLEREYMNRYFEYIGFSESQLRSNNMARKRANIRYYQNYARRYVRQRYQPGVTGFFGHHEHTALGCVDWKWMDEIVFIYVSAASVDNAWMITEAECGHILFSYAAFHGKNVKLDLRELSTRGMEYLSQWHVNIAKWSGKKKRQRI